MQKSKAELCPVDEYDVFGTITLITCPWCLSPTLYATEEESECAVCRRGITQSDIDNYLENEDV